MTLEPGTTVATYTVERLLGRGGMGEVYLATDAGLGRQVALKLLAPELAAEPRFRGRFIAESRLAASLDHPSIVPIYEAGEAAGRLFLAMRYVEGADLAELIGAEGRLEPARAVALLAGIGRALDAAHDRGLVHRDVKPGNILVAQTARGEEHAYLGDFGLVKQLGSDAGFSRSGQLVGSVDYVAPEQIEGRPVDARADVYSLACVLYTALAGGPPYPRETEMATLWAHVQQPPPRLAAGDPALAPFDAVIGAGMAKDPAERPATAGELMDLAAVAALAATGVRATPPFAAGRSPADVPNNLPPQLSSFIGRETEVGELAALFAQHRLVTLTGPGGTGKTRLAVTVAARSASGFPDGVYVIELATITDPALVPAEVASVLGVREAPGEGLDASIGRFLEARRILLVLDNLEQVDGAGRFVGRWIERAAGLVVLATSRIRLRIRQEVEFDVRPLALPDASVSRSAEEASRSTAVQLFAARASEARRDFRLTDGNAADVAAICIRVDGLPLAIELAAARVKVLSPAQILSRLSDRLGLLTGGAADLPARQQAIRSTIAWSHDLLDASAQVVFRRLAIFEGGLTFAAAEAVCVDEPSGAFLESITALVDGSLIGRLAADEDDEPRFAMLETIREFAADRLAAAGEADVVGDRHLGYFVELGQRFAAEQTHANLESWIHRLDRDRANLVAALDWGVRSGQQVAAAALFESLIDYMRARWHSGHVRAISKALLDAPSLDESARGRILHEAAFQAVRQGEHELAGAYAEQGLAIALHLGNARLAVGNRHVLALVAGERGDTAAETQIIAAMLEDADRSDEPRMAIVAQSHLALVALRGGEFEEAVARYDDLVARMRSTEVMRESLSSGLLNLGLAQLHAGRLSGAASSLAESAAISRSMDDRDLLGYVLEGYAALAIAMGRPEQAARYQGAAAAALVAAGTVLEAFEAGMRDRTATSTRSALGEAAYEDRFVAGESEPLDDVLQAARQLGEDVRRASSAAAPTGGAADAGC